MSIVQSCESCCNPRNVLVIEMSYIFYVGTVHFMCTGAKSGTSSDSPVIDDIHNALMNYIHEQPSTWAPVLSSVSHFVIIVIMISLLIGFSTGTIIKDAASLPSEVS